MGVAARVAALVVAVALVVGAIAYRSDRSGSGDDLGPVATPAAADVVTCAAELAELCRSVLADAAEAAPTAQLAAQLIADPDAVTVLPAAWADLIDDARERAGGQPLVRSSPIARTPLLLVGFTDRITVLADTCGTTIEALTWDCVGTHAGTSWEAIGGDVRWGTVGLGHLSPDTATGLQATTAIIASRTGLPFSLADLREPSFTSWFRQVERAVTDHDPAGGSHLTAMLTRGPSAANVAIATEAETVQRSQTGGSGAIDTAFGPVLAVAAEPLFEVELVVVGRDAELVDLTSARFTSASGIDALTAAGWRTGAAAPDGAPIAELPDAATTPDGGVLTAVRTVWEAEAG